MLSLEQMRYFKYIDIFPSQLVKALYSLPKNLVECHIIHPEYLIHWSISNMHSPFNYIISFSRRGNNSDKYHQSQGELGPEPFFPDNQSTDQSDPPTYMVTRPAALLSF